MLTKKELLAAAERAREYPPGYGYNWGYWQHQGVFEGLQQVICRLREEPEEARFS